MEAGALPEVAAPAQDTGAAAEVAVIPIAAPLAPVSTEDGPSKSQVRAAARRRARFGRRLAAAVWKDPFRALPSDRPLVRFLRGFMLPIGLMRTTMADPDRRKQWFRVCSIQALVVAAIGGAIAYRGTVQDIQTGNLTVGFGHAGLLVVIAYVEWCVIALSRQHHDAIGRAASVAVGVPPEDPPTVPHVAIDLRWAINKGKRRWRSFKAWSAGLPPLVVFAIIPGIGGVLVQTLLAGWTVFWFASGAAAKTAYAWRSENDAGASEPFFLRTAARLNEDTPVFRGWLPRLYLRIWRWATRGLFPPIREVEARPYEFVGLAVARIIFGLPIFYLFVRPFFPVAAADIILRGLASPRGEGARVSRPSLAAFDRVNRLVVEPASREANAVAAHRDDKED